MALIALLNTSDEIVRTEREERIDQTAGVRTGYRWVPVETDTVDNSTGPDTVTERTGPVVEAARVAYTVTIRDMTAQEISDRNDARVSQIVNDPAFKALAAAVLEIYNEVGDLMKPSRAAITPAQFRAYLKSKL